jgi:hypothetical protein
VQKGYTAIESLLNFGFARNRKRDSAQLLGRSVGVRLLGGNYVDEENKADQNSQGHEHACTSAGKFN